ncbi:MAG: hypothetical protein K2M79_04475 [Muribaculaceae bacterium]|nr:hypothetical protein [Muribaculaceae bacterium]
MRKRIYPALLALIMSVSAVQAQGTEPADGGWSVNLGFRIQSLQYYGRSYTLLPGVSYKHYICNGWFVRPAAALVYSQAENSWKDWSSGLNIGAETGYMYNFTPEAGVELSTGPSMDVLYARAHVGTDGGGAVYADEAVYGMWAFNAGLRVERVIFRGGYALHLGRKWDVGETKNYWQVSVGYNF